MAKRDPLRWLSADELARLNVEALQKYHRDYPRRRDLVVIAVMRQWEQVFDFPANAGEIGALVGLSTMQVVDTLAKLERQNRVVRLAYGGTRLFRLPSWDECDV